MAKSTKKREPLSLKEAAPLLKGSTGPCKTALEQLAKEGRRVQVVGRVRNGRVEFDPDSLDAFARRFPDANMTFVAVNAPFDPVPSAGTDSARA